MLRSLRQRMVSQVVKRASKIRLQRRKRFVRSEVCGRDRWLAEAAGNGGFFEPRNATLHRRPIDSKYPAS
jgi:hypothetical protein